MRHDAHAARRALEHLRLEAEGDQLLRDILRGIRLTVRAAFAEIARVEADEVPRDDGGFVEVGVRGHATTLLGRMLMTAGACEWTKQGRRSC
jgi:hypothetical protein